MFVKSKPSTKTELPLTKKEQKVVRLYDDMTLLDRQYRNLLSVNHCLPKHKADKIERHSTQLYIKLYNARQQFNHALKKLKTHERVNLSTKLNAQIRPV